jgi:uncharacterized protein YbjT (DUF2867 family)
MILVTGASGTVGSEVVKRLEAVKVPFRAAYFSRDKMEAARARGIDAVRIDYNRSETLHAAFGGIDRLFLLAPSVLDQAQLELNAVESAKGVGVRHIVKLSVWKADEEAYAFARLNRAIEKAIEESGLSWTFLRPNDFMQNVVTSMGETIRTEGAFYSASGDAKISHVDARDVAAVAAKVLTGPGHEGKAYILSGPEALSYDEMASELSRVLGRAISHVSLSPAELKGAMLAAGLPEEYVDWLIDLERYNREEQEQASLITNDVKEVTGREPIRFAQFARDHAALLQPERVLQRPNEAS